MILLYVDDMLITGDDTAEIIHLQEDLSIHFEIKSLGEARFFLGLELKTVISFDHQDMLQRV